MNAQQIAQLQNLLMQSSGNFIGYARQLRCRVGLVTVLPTGTETVAAIDADSEEEMASIVHGFIDALTDHAKKKGAVRMKMCAEALFAKAKEFYPVVRNKTPGVPGTVVIGGTSH